MLLQNYARTITDGKEVIKRREKEPEGDGLPPGHARIASPFVTDARWGVKREEFWLGYKLHITETSDDAPPCSCRAATAARPAAEGAVTGGRGDSGRGHDKACAHLVFPNLITHVATTDARINHQDQPSAQIMLPALATYHSSLIPAQDSEVQRRRQQMHPSMLGAAVMNRQSRTRRLARHTTNQI